MTIALALRAAPLAVAALLALALPARAVTIEEVKSAHGITAWLVEDHSVPVVSIERRVPRRRGARSRRQARPRHA